jgi:AraC-like DNA-binding protein
MQSGSDFSVSNWPLPATGVRFLVPQFLCELLRTHALSADCHPLALGYYPAARGHRMVRQHHPNHLLIHCVDGVGEVQVAGARYPVRAGDLVVLPAGQAHAYQADAQDPWSIYWVHYDGALAAEFTAFLQAGAPVVTMPSSPGLTAEFESLLGLRHAGFALPAFVHGACRLKALLTGLGGRIARASRNAGSMDLRALDALMQRRIDGSLNLDELAQAAHLSKFHFVRRFRELTGHTPIQHFIYLKMQHACRLLDGSHAPVKRVAAQVGYEDPCYFSRLFKRVIGISPQQYRASRLA